MARAYAPAVVSHFMRRVDGAGEFDAGAGAGFGGEGPAGGGTLRGRGQGIGTPAARE